MPALVNAPAEAPVLQILPLLVEACGHPDHDIGEITFNVWFCLAREIGNMQPPMQDQRVCPPPLSLSSTTPSPWDYFLCIIVYCVHVGDEGAMRLNR